MHMVRKHFLLTPEQIQSLSELDGLTPSEHIRRAIDEYIERRKRSYVSISPSKSKKGTLHVRTYKH